MRIDYPRPEDAPARRRLWQEAFGDTDAFLDLFERTAFSSDRCLCLYEGGALAAALYWFDCTVRDRACAYVYAVAVAENFRGRGYCRALMEEAHKRLAARGYAWAVLVPGDDGLFGLYHKLGYRPFGGVREVTCTAAAEGISLREIGAEAYAAARRRYLPDSAVLQEGENLRFLAAQASLYEGDGFVLAARRDGDALTAAELCGDVSLAPRIVRALGCRTGCFRSPGAEKPFAMCRPLTDENPVPPVYFGLAFD